CIDRARLSRCPDGFRSVEALRRRAASPRRANRLSPAEGTAMTADQLTIHLVSANLGRWLGPGLPEAVAEAARGYLRDNDPNRRLRGAWVALFGDDLHLHLTTCNGDFPAGEGAAPFAFCLARGAARAALARGFELGFGANGAKGNPLRLPDAEQDSA